MSGTGLDVQQQERARARVAERTPERVAACAALRDGPLLAVNDPDRAALRVDRVSRYRSGTDGVRAAAPGTAEDLLRAAAERLDADPGTAPAVLLEAVVNTPDFLPARYLEDGAVAQRAVGRVEIRDAAGDVLGHGTGFLVSPRLLLTNHHVLPDAATAGSSVLQLEFQEGGDGRPRPVTTVGLDPAALFVADPELDFALVAVAEPARTVPFGWLPLTAAQGTVVIGEAVTIVQHPGARPKEVVLRENELVDIAEQVLHYVADTEPGSSGSPVFNDQWEVVALHHASVPSPDADDSYTVVNEGIRISRVLAHLARVTVGGAQRALLDGLGTAPTGPAPSVRGGEGAPLGPASGDALASVTVDVPLQVTVTVRAGAATGTSSGAAPATAEPRGTGPAPDAEARAVDQDYADRRGYDPDFLGVPLPLPGPGRHAAVAGDPLLYHHFTVVLHRTRRLALLAAVNVDGAALDPPVRSGDRWILDPRVPRDEQTGAEVYRDNALDRGHLVRRVDPAWGPLALAANDDTFHYPNSAPQHSAVNQGSRLWLGLEDHVLGIATRDRLRISVVSGPVLADDDPPYRGVLLPRQFYKLVAVVDDDGRLAVTAYLLSQADRLPGVLAQEGAFGPYETFQVPVATVARLTGLDLDVHAAADPLAGQEAAGAARRLRTYADAVLWRRNRQVP